MKFFQFLHNLLLKGDLGPCRKWIAPLCYYLIPLGLFLYILIAYLTGNLWEASEELGTTTIVVFFVLLYAKPLAELFPKIRHFWTIVGLRRELGVLCLWLTLAHGFGPLIEEELWKGENLRAIIAWDNYLFWGIVGGIGMLILGLTSNKASLKFLRKGWKKLHLLVYPVMIASIVHVLLIDLGEYFIYAVVGIIFIILKIYVWSRKKRKNLQRG